MTATPFYKGGAVSLGRLIKKALVNSLGSRDWKHLRISLARNEALATI